MAYLAKICGLTSQTDIDYCLAAGADWLGFIFHPASPRNVAPEQVAAFDTGTARRVGVFVEQNVAGIESIMKTARLDMAQLHGDQAAGAGLKLGPERTIRVIWPQRYSSAEELAEAANCFSLEAGHLMLEAGKEGGGHGRSLDVNVLSSLNIKRPWLLAGGLTATKAKTVAGLNLPNLAGFDFNSGVEIAPGQKDYMLVAGAVLAAKNS